MAFIIDRKHDFVSSADSVGDGITPSPLSNVKIDDFLLMMWAMNDDDRLSLDDSGWLEIPGTNPLGTYVETRCYYKFATADDEQCSPWSNATASQNVYMETLCIRGVDTTNPIVDSGAFNDQGSATVLTYVSLTSTADKQLCFWISGSDADPITEGTHPTIQRLQGTSGVSDSFLYQYVSNGVETISSFTDSVPSADQCCSSGFILKDAVGSPAPLEVSPLKSLTKITPDTNNDSGWMEAIYASGIDINTGEASVDITPTLTCYGTTGQWVMRVDNASSLSGCSDGDLITFGSGATATFRNYRQYQTSSGGRGYLTMSGYTGSGETDNQTISCNGNSALCYGIGASYQINVTGMVKSSEKITNYTLSKSDGYSSVGMTDGNVYWIRDTGVADSVNEGYWYTITNHASRVDGGTQMTPTVGSATGTLTPYNMCNFEYNVDNDNDYPTGSSGTTGWKTGIVGSCRSFTSAEDMSDKLIALWQQTSSSNNAYVYFLMIDTSNNWKLWRIRSKYNSSNVYNGVDHNLISPDSINTPWFQTPSFNSNSIKYYGIMFRESSDTARNGMDTYNQYFVSTQTIMGGGSTKQVSWSDIAMSLNAEKNDFGTTYRETLQSIVPSQFMLSRSLKLSCEIGMNNEALSFPPQADGINNFLFNVDANFCGLETENVSGNINTSLIASDKGAYLTNTALDTIDYTGSIVSKYNPTLQSGKTYSQVSFVECGQIAGSATLSNCTISKHTGNGGILFDGEINGGNYTNNSYAIEIDTAGDYTLNGGSFSGNTFDVNVTASSGIVNITTDVMGLTYQTAGATVNLIAPSVSLTVANILVGSEVRIYDKETAGNNLGTELAGIESNPSNTFIYTHEDAGNEVVIQVLKDGYEEEIIESTLSVLNTIEKVYQKADSNE